MIGKVIGGRYQIIQKLGDGGFGQPFWLKIYSYQTITGAWLNI
jgi:hypothetical protein